VIPYKKIRSTEPCSAYRTASATARMGWGRCEDQPGHTETTGFRALPPGGGSLIVRFTTNLDFCSCNVRPGERAQRRFGVRSPYCAGDPHVPKNVPKHKTLSI
jgi:hypothetical protein